MFETIKFLVLDAAVRNVISVEGWYDWCIHRSQVDQYISDHHYKRQ